MARARNTIPWAARKLRLPEGQLRRAIKKGEVRVTPFAGLDRVTDAEIARIAEMLGIEIADEEGRAA